MNKTFDNASRWRAIRPRTRTRESACAPASLPSSCDIPPPFSPLQPRECPSASPISLSLSFSFSCRYKDSRCSEYYGPVRKCDSERTVFSDVRTIYDSVRRFDATRINDGNGSVPERKTIQSVPRERRDIPAYSSVNVTNHLSESLKNETSPETGEEEGAVHALRGRRCDFYISRRRGPRPG